MLVSKKKGFIFEDNNQQHFTLAQPKISFLTVNFNQPEVTLDLLNSLVKLESQDWECIVVDNGSAASSLEEDVKAFPKVKFLRSDENLGFAGGNNIGLALCEGEYIFLINNDTELPADFLNELIPFVDNSTNLGALSPRIIYHDEPDLIQYAGSTEMNKVTIRSFGVGFREKDQGQYNDIRKTPFTHGAAMLVPRKVLDIVGPMREDYFLYYEELDWCERIRQAGFDIWYYGPTFLWHKESVSTGRNSPFKTYYVNRNRLLFARRNYDAKTRVLNYLYYSFIALPKNILSFLLKGEVQQAKAFWRGYIYNLTHKSSAHADRY